MSAENTQNKIVHAHGVQFDISSILNDVTKSIQNNIQKSLDGALKDYELYKSTHDAILQIPFVRDLYIQNQELISRMDQPIQLKIDEILPSQSPVMMHSYFQFDSSKKNKKLSDEKEEEESTSTNQSDESLPELESSEEDCASESDESEAEDEEEESEAEDEEEESEDEQEEAEDEQEEAEDEQEEAEDEQEETEDEQEEAEQEEAEEAEAEQVEETEDEQEEAEAEQVEEAKDEQEETEEEVYEIMIKNVTYFTTNENNGDIYSCVDGDVGEIVGKFKNKKPVFTTRK
jgi:chemotaxis protein histidine kinase CheA